MRCVLAWSSGAVAKKEALRLRGEERILAVLAGRREQANVRAEIE